MNDVCILGAGGFVGSNLARHFGARACALSRCELDLLDQSAVDAFFSNRTFNCVFHCAVRGGSRLSSDQADVFHDNLRMFETVVKHSHKFEKFVYFSSGARFDRSSVSVGSIPSDFYGFSKYIIEKRAEALPNLCILRIYGCFGVGEPSTRFLTTCLRDKTVKIAHDCYFDYVWIEDVCEVAERYADSPFGFWPRTADLVYAEKMKLSELAELTGARYEIENNVLGQSYTGKYDSVLKLDSGLRRGIASLAATLSAPPFSPVVSNRSCSAAI